MLKKIMIVAFALTFALGFASIAAAADVTVGGSLRTEITWAYYDDEASPNGDSTFELDQFHISSSRLKFTYLSDDKKFKGYAELRLRSRSAGLNVDVRHAYFSYSWDGGSILFGQTGGMSEAYFPSQWLDAANSIIGYGKLWFDRLEQIRLTMGDKYKLKLAIEAPTHTSRFQGADGIYGPDVDTLDAQLMGRNYRYLPAFAAALDLNFGNVTIYPWMRWEWTKTEYSNIIDGQAVDFDESWHSLDFGLNINGDFGLVGFTVGAGYGINSSTMFSALASAGDVLGNTTSSVGGTNGGNGPAAPIFFPEIDDIGNFVLDQWRRADHKQINVYGELRIGGLSLGGGYTKASYDSIYGVTIWNQDPWKASAYANYSIPYGKITFIPEILWENFGEDGLGNDRGNKILVGLFAMLNF